MPRLEGLAFESVVYGESGDMYAVERRTWAGPAGPRIRNITPRDKSGFGIGILILIGRAVSPIVKTGKRREKQA